MNRIQEIMDLEHFKTLTPIQEQVLNRKNKNRDIIGVSSTGSGKSHAFFMPIFDMLDFDQDCVQAVISAPTRELAYQLYDRCRKIAKHFGVRVKLSYRWYGKGNFYGQTATNRYWYTKDV